MSNRKLSDAEVSLLNKGLKFTPTPKIGNPQELSKDINEFNRKLRLAEYFDGAEDSDISIVRNKSNFTPPSKRNDAIDEFINNVEKFPKTQIQNNIKYNLTKSELDALQMFKEDNDIIIKEADKGRATIIMNKEDYKELVGSILNDETYYTKLSTSPEKDLQLKYKKYLQKFKCQLTDKEYDYLLNFEVKTSNFYGLPKVHKSKQINEKCKSTNSGYVEISEHISDLKLRPIVAGPSCQTHRLSNLIDILLRPYTEHITSYLRDTTDFLNNLPDNIPEHTILTSFNIEALYSNIPHELGLEAVKYWIEKYPETLNSRFSKEFILEGIKFILENNTFCFNDTFFRQVKGTAMGTKFAPVYATLAIGFLEEKLYTAMETVYDIEYQQYLKKYWKRFLDDCFVPWTKSEDELKTFHSVLNNLHKDINFTLEYGFIEQPFLDVMVRNKAGKIETDIYYKETDSKQYLLFSSCHPRHTKINIPYNLARRLRTIISEQNVLIERMRELKMFLRKQNYPESLVDKGIENAMNLDKNTLRTVKKKTEDPVIPYVSTYNPKNPEMYKVIQFNLPILHEDPKMNSILSNFKMIKSKRQPDNLKRLLTKAKFNDRKYHEVKRCRRPNCGLCIHLIEGDAFEFKCGRKFYVHESMTCEVKNVLYVMKCSGCGEEYIGQTGNYLRKRVTIHNQQIRDPKTRMLYVSGHIDTCAQQLNTKYTIFPFYKMYSDSVSFRCAKENYFINLLKPKLNKST